MGNRKLRIAAGVLGILFLGGILLVGFQIHQDAVAKREIEAAKTHIAAYYQALNEKDLETLNSLTNGSYTEDYLELTTLLIDAYLDIRPHIYPGVREGEYIIYSDFKIKFKDVETPASSLTRMYLIRNADGNFIIDTLNPDAERISFYTKMDQSQEIVELSRRINEALEREAASDQQLSSLLSLIQGE